MTNKRATVVGAGLAGLSAAVRLREAGIAVTIADAAAQAGGRCRSYRDPQLGLVIDNGNHLVLSGNEAAMRYRQRVGAAPETLVGPGKAVFAFADLANGASWRVRINEGSIPWWTLSSERRVPGTHARDYLAPLKLRAAAPNQTIGERMATEGALWQRFLHPVLLAALNTDPASSSAALAWQVLRETIARGGRAMHPLVAQPTLAAAFVDPALAWLAQRDAPVALGRRLRRIGFSDDRVTSLEWSDGPQAIGPDEQVILAVPAPVAAELVPGLAAPDAFRAIVNAHFAYPPPAHAPRMLGLLGATAEWLFAFPDRISVTVSAADRLVDADREELARTFWSEICRAYGFEAPLPRWQIVKEKRATFAATPAQEARRPLAATHWRNLWLAGDWTRTGLPATIEGAIRSGETAARLAVASANG